MSYYTGDSTITGNTSSGGNTTIDSTNHASKGSVILNPSGGTVQVYNKLLGIQASNVLDIQAGSSSYVRILNNAGNLLASFVAGEGSSLALYKAAASSTYLFSAYTTTDSTTLGIRIDGSGNLGIGQASPTAYLHLKAGTASVSTAPIKFAAGTNLSSAEAGAMEWDGTNLYISQTTGPTRKTLLYADLTNVTGTLAITNGGTGQTSASTAFNALSPMTTLGDTIYGGASGAGTRLAGNITTTRNFLRQTGDGVNSTAPVWDTIVAADVPGSALTKTDDTNVTLTLGGSPSTALLNAASLTLGWTGQLGLTRGGTAASLTASNGGIVYSTASALAILGGTATANQVLLSGSSTTPAWSTATYPATTTANQLLYSSATNTVGGLATANSGVLVTSSGGVPSISSALPAGLTITDASSGNAVCLALTQNDTTNNPNAFNITNAGTGNALAITQSGVSGKTISLSVAAVTTGNIIDIANADALTTASALNIASNSASASARSLIKLANSSTSATAVDLINITQTAGAGNGIVIVNGGSTAWLGSSNSALLKVKGTNGSDTGPLSLFWGAGAQVAVKIWNDSATGIAIDARDSSAGANVETILVNSRSSANGSNYFFRNLALASTAGPLVNIENTNTGDDQPALQITNNVATSTAPTLAFGAENSTLIQGNRRTTANSAGNSLTILSGGATSAATDKAAGDLILATGLSTGTGASKVRIQTNTTALSTGTADNTATDRIIVTSPKSLANNTTATVLSCALATDSAIGLIIHYSAEVVDTTNHIAQVEVGNVTVTGVNLNGVFTVSTSNQTVYGNQQQLAAKTLVVTWTVTGANPALVQLNINSNAAAIVTGYPRVTMIVENLTQQAVTVS